MHSPGRSPLLQVPSWTGRWGVKLAYKMIDRKYEQMIGEPLNRIRRSMELPPVRGIAAWMRSPQRIICLWPESLYERKPDWPAHVETTTFVHYDGVSTVSGKADKGSETAEQEAPGRDAPVVFTAGTAMSQGKEFFAAVNVCTVGRHSGGRESRQPVAISQGQSRRFTGRKEGR